MKKVLIITYYWPPAGGPGVQRVLKFAKYLPKYGWQPVILTVENGEYPAHDESLVNEIPKDCSVYRTKLCEPNLLYKKFVGIKETDRIPVAILTEKNISWKKRIANWVRLNLFIPDAKIGWKHFAVKKGKQIIKEFKPDLIFSSSPPHTVHLIAKSLAKQCRIKWVADFRDPWTNIYHYSTSKRNSISNKLDIYLEKSVLNKASEIIVVNQGFFKNHNCDKHIQIQNGFDKSDFNFSPKKERNKKFTICYMGSMKSKNYNQTFFSILQDLSANNKTVNKFCLQFIGNVHPDVKQKIENVSQGFEVIFKGYLDHAQAVQSVSNSDLLLLIIAKSQINFKLFSGKVFEYLMMQKPILAFGPVNGAADLLLKETNAGKLFDYKDYDEAKKYILEHFQNWEKNKTYNKFNTNLIDQYNRKSLTQKLVNVFEGKYE